MALNYNIINKIWVYYWKGRYRDILDKKISDNCYLMSRNRHVIKIKNNRISFQYTYIIIGDAVEHYVYTKRGGKSLRYWLYDGSRTSHLHF